YLNAGGRLFSTHYSYQWLTYNNSPFNTVGNMWVPDQPNPPTPYTGTLDTSFPKGAAFSMWLTNVTSNPQVMGSFEIVDPRHDLDKVNPMYAQRWVYHAGDDQTEHMTFNTP